MRLILLQKNSKRSPELMNMMKNFMMIKLKTKTRE